MKPIGTGENLFPAGTVTGVLKRFDSMEQVLEFLEEEKPGVIALTRFAGSTFLSPIMDKIAGIITTTGTKTGHLAIIAREFQVLCILKAKLEEDWEGWPVLLDCTDEKVGKVYPLSLALLVGVRVKGTASAAELEEASGFSHAECAEHLETLSNFGYLRGRGERRPEYVLTESGRTILEGLLKEERKRAGEGRLNEIYTRFLPLNVELKELASAWQVRETGVPNDHSDNRYDTRIIRRLTRLHHSLIPLLHELVQIISRYQAYLPRLIKALHALDQGGIEYFTSPRPDSYHSVWFELHEDLLCTLGRERTE